MSCHLFPVERKISVFTSNAKAVSTHSKIITAETKALLTKLEEFIKTSNQSTTKLHAEAKQYQTKELEILVGQSERIDVQLKRVKDALQVIQSKDAISGEAASREGARARICLFSYTSRHFQGIAQYALDMHLSR